jgi:transcriptional regulator of NAD metabolism
MNAEERRRAITDILVTSDTPVSATALARRFSVSRQIIVGDIALLRAAGADISATPRGYMIPASHDGLIRTVACNHDRSATEEELNIIVDNGCTVLDVVVEHPLYGQLTGQLQLSSRYDVSQFILRLSSGNALPLSALTDGIHLHTIRCPDENAYHRVTNALEEAGILFKNADND